MGEVKLSAFPSVRDGSANRDDSSSSSHGSSSGNPVDSLRDSLEHLDFRSSGRTSPDGPARRDAIRLEIERGRDRAPTPLRNNESDPPDFATILKLLEGESILFDSPVESRTPRRRASRILLPIAGPSVKSKRRHLVLTDRRLFCLKPNLSIKSELLLRPSEKAKDSRGVVNTVELRGEREFIVMASSKNFIYGVLYPFSASVWHEKIINALDQPSQPST